MGWSCNLLNLRCHFCGWESPLSWVSTWLVVSWGPQAPWDHNPGTKMKRVPWSKEKGGTCLDALYSLGKVTPLRVGLTNEKGGISKWEKSSFGKFYGPLCVSMVRMGLAVLSIYRYTLINISNTHCILWGGDIHQCAGHCIRLNSMWSMIPRKLHYLAVHFLHSFRLYVSQVLLKCLAMWTSLCPVLSLVW